MRFTVAYHNSRTNIINLNCIKAQYNIILLCIDMQLEHFVVRLTHFRRSTVVFVAFPINARHDDPNQIYKSSNIC